MFHICHSAATQSGARNPCLDGGSKREIVFRRDIQAWAPDHLSDGDGVTGL